MQLKTLEWARGLRDSLRAEIDRLLTDGVNTPEGLERVVALRAQLLRAESLIHGLEAYFPDSAKAKGEP